MAKDLSKIHHCIFFCTGGSCTKKGAEEITREVRAHLRMEGLYTQTHTVKTLCMGRCTDGPNIQVMPDGVWYKEMTVEKGIELVEKHIKENTIPEHYVLFKPGWDSVQSKQAPVPAPKKDFRLLTDDELGTVMLAHADAWEMNLYPMLRAIFIRFCTSAGISLPGAPHEVYRMKHPATICYKDQYIKISTAGFSIELLIGILAKEAPYELQNERIFFVDVFKQTEEPFKHGIRFRNKSGKTKLVVADTSPELLLWEHVVKIYLDKEEAEIRDMKRSHHFLTV